MNRYLNRPVLRDANSVLAQLRDTLIREGWLQHHPSMSSALLLDNSDEDGRCPHDVIVRMMATTPARAQAIKLLARAVGGETSIDFLRWNDARGRTKAEVIALIDSLLDHEMLR